MYIEEELNAADVGTCTAEHNLPDSVALLLTFSRRQYACQQNARDAIVSTREQARRRLACCAGGHTLFAQDRKKDSSRAMPSAFT